MNIRDGHALINGDDTTFIASSGTIDIIAKDGRSLYDLQLNGDGSLCIRVNGAAKHNGIIFDDRLIVHPSASNAIRIERKVYEQPVKKH